MTASLQGGQIEPEPDSPIDSRERRFGTDRPHAEYIPVTSTEWHGLARHLEQACDALLEPEDGLFARALREARWWEEATRAREEAFPSARVSRSVDREEVLVEEPSWDLGQTPGMGIGHP